MSTDKVRYAIVNGRARRAPADALAYLNNKNARWVSDPLRLEQQRRACGPICPIVEVTVTRARKNGWINPLPKPKAKVHNFPGYGEMTHAQMMRIRALRAEGEAKRAARALARENRRDAYTMLAMFSAYRKPAEN